MLLVPDAAVTSTGNDVVAIDNDKKIQTKQTNAYLWMWCYWFLMLLLLVLAMTWLLLTMIKKYKQNKLIRTCGCGVTDS